MLTISMLADYVAWVSDSLRYGTVLVQPEGFGETGYDILRMNTVIGIYGDSALDRLTNGNPMLQASVSLRRA